HALQRREIDAVLPLVVGGAASVPSTVRYRHIPGRATFAPLLIVAGHYVAVPIDEHGGQRRVLQALRKEHRRRAIDRIRPDRDPKPEPLDTGGDFIANIREQRARALGKLALGAKPDPALQVGEKLAAIEPRGSFGTRSGTLRGHVTSERVVTAIGPNTDFPPASSAFGQRIAHAPIVARKRQRVLD